MANRNKVWGQTKIRVNGTIYDTEGRSSLEIGGTKREAVSADHKAGHFMESTEPSKLTCSLLVTAGISLTELQKLDDVVATMEADTGQTYVINHAYVADILSVSEGKASLVIQGPPAEELVV
jgi:Phage tail tube protein